MMPINLFVVRHGESIGNVAKRMSEGGDHSVLEKLRGTHTAHWSLTKKGIEQAKKAGAFLNTMVNENHMYFDKMYVSSYARAMKTAAHLDLIRSKWIVDTRITERDWGDFDRMTEDERLEKFGESLKMHNVEPFFWAPPNGESFNGLLLRLRDLIDSLIRAQVTNAVVVCHGEVMKAFRIIFLQLTPMEYAEMEFSKDSLKRIRNCQIDHYTRRDPKTLALSERLDWLRIYRPAEDSLTPNSWISLPRKRYNSFDLHHMANKLSAPFDELGL